MTHLTITHSHAEGTLIAGTAKGDGSAAALKANRWRWGRSIGAWYVPHSRDRDAHTWQINATARELREAGFEVDVEIDNTPRPAEVVETERVERAAGRAAALDTKATRRQDAADRADAASDAADRALPYGGEPIKVGHHSEARHRRAIDTAHRRMGQAVAAQREADETARRAEVAATATDRRYSPQQVANRIAKLEAEIRGTKRHLDGYTRERGTPYAEQVPAATGSARDHHRQRLAAQQDHLAYWQRVRAEQVASGEVREYAREQISSGDTIRSGGSWYLVARANPKTVSVYLDAERGVVSSYRVPYAQIRDHRPAAQG
jgi:hypothetical protein